MFLDRVKKKVGTNYLPYLVRSEDHFFLPSSRVPSYVGPVPKNNLDFSTNQRDIISCPHKTIVIEDVVNSVFVFLFGIYHRVFSWEID